MSQKGTVLIVEDQEGFRNVYEDVLVSDGYSVILAVDGEEGWELARTKKPNLILLDLGLPKLDGFEVLRLIRETDATKDIPVIIFSVMGEQKDIKKALEMGANDYTVKGFYTPRQILSKIKGLVTQLDVKGPVVSYKLQVKEDKLDAVKLREEVGLPKGYLCPDCKVELVLEMFPDYVRQGGHWYSSRLSCPNCAKAF